jgi:hypothetical protein
MSIPTVAQDKLGITNLVPEGATALGAQAKVEGLQNIFAGVQANWSGAGDGILAQNDIWFIGGRVEPTSSDYPNAPIGSLFFCWHTDSAKTNPYDSKLFIKTQYGWEATDTMLYASVSLTLTQLLALYTTPIQIVAAPGATKAIVPIRAAYQYTYGSAAFGLGSVVDLEIRYTGTSGAALIKMPTTGVLDQTANATAWGAPQANAIMAANAIACVHITGANPTTGTGCSAKVGFWYKVMDVAAF